MPPIRLAIHGAAGRMGQRLIALASADAAFKVAAALDAANHPRLGEDAGIVAGARQPPAERLQMSVLLRSPGDPGARAFGVSGLGGGARPR